jgi:hypothetical protein
MLSLSQTPTRLQISRPNRLLQTRILLHLTSNLHSNRHHSLYPLAAVLLSLCSTATSNHPLVILPRHTTGLLSSTNNTSRTFSRLLVSISSRLYLNPTKSPDFHQSPMFPVYRHVPRSQTTPVALDVAT